MNKGLHTGFAQSGLPQLVQELLYDKTLVANGIFDTAEKWAQGIPPIYERLSLVLLARSTQATNNTVSGMEFNGDGAAANFNGTMLVGIGASSVGCNNDDTFNVGGLDGTTSAADMWSLSEITIMNPSDASKFKRFSVRAHYDYNGNGVLHVGAKSWKSKDIVNRLRLYPSNYPTDSYIAGSNLQIYGHRLVYPQS